MDRSCQRSDLSSVAHSLLGPVEKCWSAGTATLLSFADVSGQMISRLR